MTMTSWTDDITPYVCEPPITDITGTRHYTGSTNRGCIPTVWGRTYCVEISQNIEKKTRHPKDPNSNFQHLKENTHKSKKGYWH